MSKKPKQFFTIKINRNCLFIVIRRLLKFASLKKVPSLNTITFAAPKKFLLRLSPVKRGSVHNNDYIKNEPMS